MTFCCSTSDLEKELREIDAKLLANAKERIELERRRFELIEKLWYEKYIKER